MQNTLLQIVITRLGIRYTRNAETLSWALSTVKIILMAPSLLLYDLETLRNLVGLILDRFTFNRKCRMLGSPNLKRRLYIRYMNMLIFYEIPKLTRNIRVYWISSLTYSFINYTFKYKIIFIFFFYKNLYYKTFFYLRL